MNNKFIVGLVLTVVVLLGLYLIFSSQSSAPVNAPANDTTTSGAPQASPSQASPKTLNGKPITTPVSTTKSVKIQSFAFSPDTDVVSAGTKITWTNYDSVPHTVTSNDGLFASKTLNTGSTFSFTFNKKGTFYYHCTFHTDMLGRIIVQ